MADTHDTNTRWQAVLLLGPTGSGKTPLGRLLEEQGLGGQRCLHFDFGEALRRAADERDLLTPAQQEIVVKSLRSGALLEDRHFGIAKKLLVNYVESRSVGETLLVLNGLPRHAGQARAMELWVRMRAVVVLNCSPETAWERIRCDVGGDRGGRGDDTLDEVRRRCSLFEARTAPLVEHYRAHGVAVLVVAVGATTGAGELVRQITVAWHRLAPRR